MLTRTKIDELNSKYKNEKIKRENEKAQILSKANKDKPKNNEDMKARIEKLKFSDLTEKIIEESIILDQNNNLIKTTISEPKLLKYGREKLLQINDSLEFQSKIYEKVKKRISISRATTRKTGQIKARDILAGKGRIVIKNRSTNNSFCENSTIDYSDVTYESELDYSYYEVPDTTQLDQASDTELCNMMSPTLQQSLHRKHSSYD